MAGISKNSELIGQFQLRPGEALGITNVVDGAATEHRVLLSTITPGEADVPYSVFREGRNGMTVVTLIFPTGRVRAVTQ